MKELLQSIEGSTRYMGHIEKEDGKEVIVFPFGRTPKWAPDIIKSCIPQGYVMITERWAIKIKAL